MYSGLSAENTLTEYKIPSTLVAKLSNSYGIRNVSCFFSTCEILYSLKTQDSPEISCCKHLV